MNTGIRNRDAASGALLVEMASDDESATEEAIRRTLLAVRPMAGRRSLPRSTMGALCSSSILL